jgi:hypothetical protein
MRFGSIPFNLLGSEELRQALSERVQQATSTLFDLQIGEQIPAQVVKVSPLGVLINLKGSQLLLQGLSGLKAGTELIVKVTGLEPQISLQVLSSVSPRQAPLLAFEIGQEVTAKVAEQSAEGSFLIDIQGASFEAFSPEELPIGSWLNLRVEQLEPHLAFQIIDPQSDMTTAALQLMRDHLPHSATAAQSLERLQQALLGLANIPLRGDVPTKELALGLNRMQTLLDQFLPQGTPPDGRQIITLVRDGGLQYESKLAAAVVSGHEEMARIAQGDLKGQILYLLQAVERAAEPAEASTVAAPLEDHLGHIETQQALNLLAQAYRAPFQFQIPFPSTQGPTTAFLSVEPEAHGSTESGATGSGHHIMLQFDAEELGRTSIDAYVAKHILRVIFYVEHSGGLNLLQTELSGFRNQVQDRFGFQDVLLAARPLTQLSAEKKERFTALSAGIPAKVNVIDTRA